LKIKLCYSPLLICFLVNCFVFVFQWSHRRSLLVSFSDSVSHRRSLLVSFFDMWLCVGLCNPTLVRVNQSQQKISKYLSLRSVTSRSLCPMALPFFEVCYFLILTPYLVPFPMPFLSCQTGGRWPPLRCTIYLHEKINTTTVEIFQSISVEI
jgi:hypothetical protein